VAVTSTPTATPTPMTPTVGPVACGNRVEDPGETCDDGGYCVNDSINIDCEDNKPNTCPDGRACVNRFCVCTNNDQCESGQECVQGFCMLRCTQTADCPSRMCVPQGGDGCAANCTDETGREARLDSAKSPSRVQTTNTVIDLKKLHLDFGTNPVDAKALITKMYPTNVDADLSAKLNLAELNKMFPMEGLTMKGNYAINLKAKGIYDSLKKTIPAVDASMSLANGFVKSADVPLPLDDLHFTSTIKNASGKMSETFITVKDFAVLLDGEKFSADLLLQNLDDYTWDLKVKGGVDLEKMTKIFPLEGMTLAGKVKANIETKGKYSDVQAEKYDRLPTSGSASLSNFKYITKDLPPVTLSQAGMTFDPKKIELQNVNGTIGKSDFRLWNWKVLVPSCCKFSCC